MNRRDHLLKAEAALGQVIENLRRAGEDELADMFAKDEAVINDLIPPLGTREQPQPIVGFMRDYDPYEEGGTLA